jgi:hypothetical protein
MDECPQRGADKVREIPGDLGPADGWYGEPETPVDAGYTVRLGECAACGTKVSPRLREGKDESVWHTLAQI